MATPSASHVSCSNSGRRIRRWKRLLFAILVTLGFFTLLELVLWLSGVSTLIERGDPFQGFSGLVNVFQREGEVYRTCPAGADTFNAQTFLARKPADGLRIFCLGESSSYGFPWGAETAFTGIIGEALAATHPERKIEAVNASGVSYAVHRLNLVADELLSYEPDIFIIYSGNNEFIEPGYFDAFKNRSAWRTRAEYLLAQSRTYSGLSSLLGRSSRSASLQPGTFQLSVQREEVRIYTSLEKEAVVAEYRWRLERLVRRAHDSGVKIVLCTVPCNLREWRPAASTTLSGLSQADRQAWSNEIAVSQRLLAAGDLAGAIPHLEHAALLAPGHADTQFRLAQSYDVSGRWDDARLAYQRACDADASPQRRLSAINEVIRQVAQDHGALLVDVDQIFTQRSEHGLVGYNIIEDYVHPTREGHEVIAWHIWDAIERAGWLGPKSTADRAAFERIVTARRNAPVAANPVWLFNQGVVLQNQGQTAAAIKKYREAIALSPAYAGAMMNLSYSLLEAGEFSEAAEMARRVTEIDPRNGVAYNNWGFALAKLERFEEAVEHCREAVRLRPDIPKFHVNLGYSLLGAGRTPEAIEQYREAIRLNPDDADAHNDLGFTLQSLGKFDEAVAQYREAIRLRPDHPLAGNNLKRVSESLPTPQPTGTAPRQ